MYLTESYDKPSDKVFSILEAAASRENHLLNEYEAYDLFREVGISVPPFFYFPLNGDKPALDPTKKYVAKASIPGCIHKTDIGGISFNITLDSFDDCVADMTARLGDKGLEGILFVEMVSFHTKGLSGGELLISAFEDEAFGPCVAFGLGGTAVEYMKEVMLPSHSAVFLPVWLDLTAAHVRKAIEKLPAAKFLTGKVRGFDKQCETDEIISTLQGLASLMRYFSRTNKESPFVLEEVEINPAVVSKHDHRLLALDGVVRVSPNPNYQSKGHHSVFTANKPIHKIGLLVDPKSVAIVGVSSKNTSGPGATILSKFITNGRVPLDQLAVIHPREKEIQGVKCYPTPEALLEARGGKPVDLFVVGVPARRATPLMEKSIDIHLAESIFIISGGFGETEDGKRDEAKLKAKLLSMDDYVRRPLVNGPNTLGFAWTGRTDTVFVPAEKNSFDGTGSINAALICQSGAFMISRRGALAGRVAPTLTMSVGNQLCISATDMLEWLLKDPAAPQLDTFGMYVEGLNPGDGVRLMRLVSEAREAGKVVVIYKAGRTAEGQDAAKGHTASMAGDYSMFAHLLDLAGAIVTPKIPEFENAMHAAAMLAPRLAALRATRPALPLRLASMTNAGFEKCAIADHSFEVAGCHAYMKLPEYGEEASAKITEIFHKFRIAGVVDIAPILDTTPSLDDEGIESLCRVIMSAEEISVGLISCLPESQRIHTLTSDVGGPVGEAAEKDPTSVVNRMIRLYHDGPQKPWVWVVDSGRLYDGHAKFMNAAGVPTFRTVDSAATALAHVLRACFGDL
eukprot:gnl/Dysnectes_brevis/356_a394_2758.p1 GENE.gnl/Dysnectes_brevis/356_a394_2758~~gnl/Dysnectes_brevis/356_a394_2758.p1  ORF type:complete len:796 (+),score=289.82 gnl/Dysnectes_brevis/356_a394_2758:53-2440(+)